MARRGVGIDDVCADMQYDFLSFFNDINDEDSVPDSFFINNHCSPYSNLNLNCKYIDSTEFSSIKSNKFTTLSLNIQSLSSKFNELSEFINELSNTNSSPDVICLQETWNVLDGSLFPLNDYQQLIFNNRNNSRGGGVGIYVKNHLTVKVLSKYSIFLERSFESLFVEITLASNKKIVIGSVYCPPKTPGLTFTKQFEQFSETLYNLLAEIGNVYENVFVYGDFNLNVLDLQKNKFVAEYIDTIFSHGFLQLVTKPTRINENSATLIDHILTNSTVQVHDTFIICSKISDHFPILHQLDFNKVKPKLNPIETRSFSEENITKFKRALRDYNWNFVTNLNCTQTAFNDFSTTFNTFYNLYFPIHTIV